jgi:hypothetical protein
MHQLDSFDQCSRQVRSVLSLASDSVQYRVNNHIFNTLPHSMLEASEVVMTAAESCRG